MGGDGGCERVVIDPQLSAHFPFRDDRVPVTLSLFLVCALSLSCGGGGFTGG